MPGIWTDSRPSQREKARLDRGRVRPSDVCTSPIVVGEIELSLERRDSPGLRQLTERLFDSLSVVPYDVEAGRHYGRLAAHLQSTGTPIGVEDTMVAAHALSLDLSLVTHNVKHFERVAGLRVEDWY